MQPTIEQTQELEKFMDALSSYGVICEFRPSRNYCINTGRIEDFLNLYIHNVNNPANQIHLCACAKHEPDTAIIGVMAIMAVLTDSHYQEVVDRVKHMNGDCYEEGDMPFEDVCLFLRDIGINPVSKYNPNQAI